MEVIKLKELYEQYKKVQILNKVTWEDIDPIRYTLESKCFKINNEWEARFIVWLMEQLFWYTFYNNRKKGDTIYNSVDWGYMCFSPCSWWWLPEDYANDIFRTMDINACFEKDIGEYYEEIKIRELEIYRWTDVELLINKMFEDWLI